MLQGHLKCSGWKRVKYTFWNQTVPLNLLNSNPFSHRWISNYEHTARGISANHYTITVHNFFILARNLNFISIPDDQQWLRHLRRYDFLAKKLSEGYKRVIAGTILLTVDSHRWCEPKQLNYILNWIKNLINCYNKLLNKLFEFIAFDGTLGNCILRAD